MLRWPLASARVPSDVIDDVLHRMERFAVTVDGAEFIVAKGQGAFVCPWGSDVSYTMQSHASSNYDQITFSASIGRHKYTATQSGIGDAVFEVWEFDGYPADEPLKKDRKVLLLS